MPARVCLVTRMVNAPLGCAQESASGQQVFARDTEPVCHRMSAPVLRDTTAPTANSGTATERCIPTRSYAGVTERARVRRYVSATRDGEDSDALKLCVLGSWIIIQPCARAMAHAVDPISVLAAPDGLEYPVMFQTVPQ